MCPLCQNFNKTLPELSKGDILFARSPLYQYYGSKDMHPAPLRFCPTCGRRLYPNMRSVNDLAEFYSPVSERNQKGKEITGVRPDFDEPI